MMTRGCGDGTFLMSQRRKEGNAWEVNDQGSIKRRKERREKKEE